MIRALQPEETDKSQNYTGWKGVLRWCAKDWGLFDEASENGINDSFGSEMINSDNSGLKRQEVHILISHNYDQ